MVFAEPSSDQSAVSNLQRLSGMFRHLLFDSSFVGVLQNVKFVVYNALRGPMLLVNGRHISTQGRKYYTLQFQQSPQVALFLMNFSLAASLLL